MRWNCKSHGGVICIKNVNYGGTYVPKEEERAKETKKPTGDNALDAIKEDIARIQDELIKQNRDNLDAMYNLDMDNFSASFRKTFGNALSEFKLIADDTKAQFEALAQWKTDTTNSIASIRGTANANSATLESIASWQSGVNSSISSIRQTANANSSSISSITSWQKTVENGTISSIASIEQKASENSASISNIVSLTGADGKTLYAAFKVAAEGDESFIQAIADKVEISAGEIDLNGYVKFTDLSNDNGKEEVEGFTGISGNSINLFMYVGQGETSDYDATSGLTFSYACRMYEDEYGKIRAEVNGDNNSVTESRYKLTISTSAVRNYNGNYYRHPGIKLRSNGRMSITSGLDENGYGNDDGTEGSIYMATYGGYITMETQYGVRIRAYSSYDDCVANYASASSDYVFASDGIYYGGNLLIST